MLAKHISVNKEIYATSDTPVPKVFQRMIEKNCPCIPIVETMAHKNMIGVVTEHDICLKTIIDGLNPQRISAGRVMNGHFTTVSGEATIEDCIELMKLSKAEWLFVVDEDNAVLGMLSEKEIRSVETAAIFDSFFSNLTAPPVLPADIRSFYRNNKFKEENNYAS